MQDSSGKRQPATAPQREDGLRAAIEAAGNVSSLANLLGLSRVSVWKWKRVPAERVLVIEAALKGAVPRHRLRPDIYPQLDAKA